LQGVALNPMPWAIVLGALASALQISLPAALMQTLLRSASNVALLAKRFGADNGRIARIILLLTVLTFFTLSGFVALKT